jgi:ribonuclease HI
MTSDIQIYEGYTDGASRHTRNIASAAWILYSPTGLLVSSGGSFLGPATNNVAEYSAVIELLMAAISLGITSLIVRLDSQLVASQLNGAYQVRHPTLLRLFLRVRLLEREFVFITYLHVPRNQNTVADELANYILDWHLSHLH